MLRLVSSSPRRNVAMHSQSAGKRPGAVARMLGNKLVSLSLQLALRSSAVVAALRVWMYCSRDRRRRSTVARPLDRAEHRRVRASRQIALSMRLLAVHPRLPARVPCAPRACPVPFFLFVCAAACRPLVCRAVGIFLLYGQRVAVSSTYCIVGIPIQLYRAFARL